MNYARRSAKKEQVYHKLPTSGNPGEHRDGQERVLLVLNEHNHARSSFPILRNSLFSPFASPRLSRLDVAIASSPSPIR